jgi:hypothetical protein
MQNPPGMPCHDGFRFSVVRETFPAYSLYSRFYEITRLLPPYTLPARKMQ